MSEQDLPYERVRPNAYEWTEKAYELLVAGTLDGRVDRYHGMEAATVVGACPRCTHQFRFESAHTAVGTGGRTLESDEAVSDPDEYVPVDVGCRCTGEHPGRPDGEAGCGVSFRIEVRAEAHDD